MWRIAWVFCLLVLSCTRDIRPTDDSCTGSTPLIPGILGSPGHLIPSDVNPNGTSELAALMRRFVVDLREARAAIEHGHRPPALWTRHRKMRCAWPTEPSDRDQAFDARALVYLELLRSLEENPKEPKVAYQRVLSGCRACHEAQCPGPLEVIDGLTLWSGSPALQ